ncbi:MAG TPA: hypothetical protein VEZ47_04555 [Gemmatirosa sp.]|nr:hypothetical protein [Gemmatirosa sp.]
MRPLVRQASRLALCTTLVACASAGGPPDAETAASTPRAANVTPNQALAGTGGMQADVTTIRSNRADVIPLAAAPGPAYAALVQAYAHVGLTPTSMSTDARELGVGSAKVRRRLGEERLSRYLSCGERMSGMPNADEYDVRLTVTSRIVAVPEDTARSVLTTFVQANARPVSTGGAMVTCSSTGELERRLAKRVGEYVAGAP